MVEAHARHDSGGGVVAGLGVGGDLVEAPIIPEADEGAHGADAERRAAVLGKDIGPIEPECAQLGPRDHEGGRLAVALEQQDMMRVGVDQAGEIVGGQPRRFVLLEGLAIIGRGVDGFVQPRMDQRNIAIAGGAIGRQARGRRADSGFQGSVAHDGRPIEGKVAL